MTPTTRDSVRLRLRKISGQVAALERMIDDDRYCVDVLLQVAAVRGALDKAGKLLLEDHVGTCVSQAMKSGRPKEREQKVAELMDVFSRFAQIGGR